MGIIELTDVTRGYGETTAVSELSLDVEEGEIYGLLGPNGAGKTTTIELIIGTLTADSGSVSVLGIDPATNPVKAREPIGVLPERESPISLQTPREYFKMIGDIRDIPSHILTDQIRAWSARLEFGEQLDTLNMNLSRGQQQKVMITQAFLHDPSLIVIDEPLVNLDPYMQSRVKEWLTSEGESERTILVSTHDVGVAADICDRIGIMGDGSLAREIVVGADDTADTVLDAFNDEFSYAPDPMLNNGFGHDSGGDTTHEPADNTETGE